MNEVNGASLRSGAFCQMVLAYGQTVFPPGFRSGGFLVPSDAYFASGNVPQMAMHIQAGISGLLNCAVLPPSVGLRCRVLECLCSGFTQSSVWINWLAINSGVMSGGVKVELVSNWSGDAPSRMSGVSTSPISFGDCAGSQQNYTSGGHRMEYFE